MARYLTDLSRVPISVAPSPATSGTSLGVTDANAAFLPDQYPWYAVLVPVSTSPTRSNAEIVKVTGGLSSGGTTTLTIVRAQGSPVTTAQSVTTSFDIFNAIAAETIGLASFYENETPSGTVNGSNVTFTLTTTPVTGSLQLFRDGQLMKGGGADYTLTTNSIAFVTAPATGSVLLAFYKVAATTSGNADTVDSLHATQYGNNSGILIADYLGWLDLSNTTFTYSSVDGATGVVTINADLTGYIQAGDRIKFTQTTVKYFIVTKTPTYGAGVTTLTFWGGTDYTLVNAAITAPFFSHKKDPFGFNTDPTKWTSITNSTADSSGSSAGYNNVGTLSLDIHIGTWDVSYQGNAFATKATACGVITALSTANNSQGDVEMTASIGGAVGATYGFVHRRKILTLTSKTTYYLNTAPLFGSETGYGWKGASYGNTIIRAVCAFL